MKNFKVENHYLHLRVHLKENSHNFINFRVNFVIWKNLVYDLIKIEGLKEGKVFSEVMFVVQVD